MSLQTLISRHAAPILICRPSDYIMTAVGKMVDGGVNAICVAQNNTSLAGILTDHDIIRALNERGGSLGTARVDQWMSRNVVTCPSSAKLAEALNLMGKHRIRHLTVVEDLLPVAIVSIRDILALLHEEDLIEKGVLRDLARISRTAPV